jgi:hypothetical protein
MHHAASVVRVTRAEAMPELVLQHWNKFAVVVQLVRFVNCNVRSYYFFAVNV